jgi:hypothetical protein
MNKYSQTVQEAMNHCAVLHQDVRDRRFLAIRDSLFALKESDSKWNDLTRQRLALDIDGRSETVR